MDKTSRIYVAGHRGLVGSAIYRRLESGGFTNLITRTSRELDLTRQADVEAFFKKENPEYVFLAAAKVGGILANNTYPADFIYGNMMIQSNIIHASYLNGAKKLLFLGSSCIYPKLAPQPMKEEYLLGGQLEPTNEPYAVAKIAGIKMCQSYNRQYRTNYISVMPTNLYGPRDNFDLSTSHVLPALIRKFHEGKMKMAQVKDEGIKQAKAEVKAKGNLSQPEPEVISQPEPEPEPAVFPEPRPQPDSHSVSIWGTGTPRREFLYVDDLADACLFLMERYDSSEIINIGEGEIIYDSSKPDGTPRKLLDVSRLHSLGWRARTSLEEGIRKTYEWYVKTEGEG
jgi:GDP-L-fucose synthase